MDLDLEELRLLFPGAYGAQRRTDGTFPSYDKLYAIGELAIAESGIRDDGRDARWIDDNRCRKLLILNAFISGVKRRDSGMLDLAHPIQVGHDLRHDTFLLVEGFDSNWLGFKGTGHDTGEAAAKQKLNMYNEANAFAAHFCWGNAYGNSDLMRWGLDSLTDTPFLHGYIRLLEQEQRMRIPSAMGIDDRRCRFYDKLRLIREDVVSLCAGRMTFDQIVNRTDQAETKLEIIEAALPTGHITPDMVELYMEPLNVLRNARTTLQTAAHEAAMEMALRFKAADNLVAPDAGIPARPEPEAALPLFGIGDISAEAQALTMQ